MSTKKKARQKDKDRFQARTPYKQLYDKNGEYIGTMDLEFGMSMEENDTGGRNIHINMRPAFTPAYLAVDRLKAIPEALSLKPNPQSRKN